MNLRQLHNEVHRLIADGGYVRAGGRVLAFSPNAEAYEIVEIALVEKSADPNDSYIEIRLLELE